MNQLPIEQNVGRDHLYAIGLLTAQWAHVEALVKLAVVRLTNPHNERMVLVVVNHVPFRNLLESLETAVAVHLDQVEHQDAQALAKEFSKFAKRLMKIYKRRNVFAHNTLAPGSRKGFVKPIAIDTRKGVKTLKGEWSANGIHQITHRMYNLVEELGDFFRRADIDLDVG